MNDCDDIIDGFHAMEGEQLSLAETAVSAPVAAMHAELADFAGEQAAIAEDICED